MGQRKRHLREAVKAYEHGIKHNNLGNWGFAEEEFVKALLHFQALERWEDALNCHESIGNVNHNKGNLKETLRHWGTAVEIALEKVGDVEKAVQLLMDIGDLHVSQEEIYAAGYAYERALRLVGEDQLLKAQLNHRLGNVCYSQERMQAAEQHYFAAIEAYQSLGMEGEYAAVLKGIGNIYYGRGDYETAKRHYQEVWGIFSKMQKEDAKRELRALLMDIEHKEKQKVMSRQLRELMTCGGAGGAYGADLAGGGRGDSDDDDDDSLDGENVANAHHPGPAEVPACEGPSIIPSSPFAKRVDSAATVQTHKMALQSLVSQRRAELPRKYSPAEMRSAPVVKKR